MSKLNLAEIVADKGKLQRTFLPETIITEAEQLAGVTFTDYQREAMEVALAMAEPQRMLLFYKTGAGKTLTALVCLGAMGYSEAVVITPPSTFGQWHEAAKPLGITVHPMSHATFRMKKTLLSRRMPVIADEFHLFGGHEGQGWKKLDRLSRGLKAPMILASATPNYNDAERVYCIKHILQPQLTKGGFLEFLYQNCNTKANPFSMTPNVEGFINYPDAASYLAALPGTMYLADDLVYQIEDRPVRGLASPALAMYGYNLRDHKMVASDIERRHYQHRLDFTEASGELRDEVKNELLLLLGSMSTKKLIFCNHSETAKAIHEWLATFVDNVEIVTGKTSRLNKELTIAQFNAGEVPILVGTASLATGTDGMDKVCDLLIIADDTDDPALRRQLIGRIMPRGINAGGTPASGKHVYRLVFQ